MFKLLPAITLGVLSIALVTPSSADDSYMQKFNECNQTAAANCEVWKDAPNASENAYTKCTEKESGSSDTKIIRQACTLACYEAVNEHSAKGATCPELHP